MLFQTIGNDIMPEQLPAVNYLPVRFTKFILNVLDGLFSQLFRSSAPNCENHFFLEQALSVGALLF